MSDTSAANLRQRVFSGLLWQGMARGGDRMARLVTNIVLARLLAPDDFGLMGVVAAALAPVDAVTFLASEQAIVQNPNSRERRFLETTFWVTAIRGVLLGLLIVAIAPFAAWYFGRPDALPLFAAIGLQPVFQGLMSPRVHLLLKDLRFQRWSLYRLACSLCGMAVAVAIAIWLRSAWALLIGQLMLTGAQALGSYVVAPLRPRLTFDRETWKQLRTYGARAAGTPLLMMFVMQAPALLLGRFAGLEALGVFMLTQRLVDVPSEISQQVVGSVAMPAYSALQEDRARLARAWLRAVRMVTLVVLPIAALLGWIGQALPAAVYGAQYTPAAGLVGLLALAALLRSLGSVIGPVFWAVGLPSLDRRAQLLRVGVVYIAGIPLVATFASGGMATALIAGLISALLASAWLVRTVLPVKPAELWSAVQPGVIGAAALLAGLLTLDLLHAPHGWLRIGIAAGVGFVALVGVVLYLRPLRAWKARQHVAG